ncbi:hypothetical protein BJV78DRAFT_1284088 [Lactifluus subvellereus]|nr:hypothetical protein BJV78DRAFT_1284088 [Lactifluus subvellereus]
MAEHFPSEDLVFEFEITIDRLKARWSARIALYFITVRLLMTAAIATHFTINDSVSRLQAAVNNFDVVVYRPAAAMSKARHQQLPQYRHQLLGQPAARHDIPLVHGVFRAVSRISVLRRVLSLKEVRILFCGGPGVLEGKKLRKGRMKRCSLWWRQAGEGADMSYYETFTR